jgi:Tfp pilus assembly protein PilF
VIKIPGDPIVLTPADRALGHFLKGKVALDRGDAETALVAFEQAVTNDPASTFLRLQLAKLYVRKGKLAEALEHCRKAREQEPNNAEAELLMAGLLSSMNQ